MRYSTKTMLVMPENGRPSKLDVILASAVAHSKRSTCGPGRSHGAVIHANGRILAASYNGPPRGWPTCKIICQLGEKDDLGHDWRKCPAVHAEVNALLSASEHGISIIGAHMVITRSPCMGCLLLLCNSALDAVWWPDDENDRWVSLDLSMPDRALQVWKDFIGDN